MMTSFLILFGGMAAAFWCVGLLDWLGQRQERRTREQNRAA